MQYQRFVIQKEQQQGNIIELNQQQHHYLRRVLRLSPGDRAIALTGKGKAWIVELTADQAKIVHPITLDTELPITITLLMAIPKQGVDEVIRCGTELGVSSIVPVLSERTLPKPSHNKLTRWRRIAQEAAEQSERAIVPSIIAPVQLTEALVNYGSGHQNRYFCTARHDVPSLTEILLGQPWQDQDSVVIATGCEGGWSEAELQQAQQANFRLVSLGHRILRAVTAPITATSLIAGFAEMGNAESIANSSYPWRERASSNPSTTQFQ